MLDQPSREVLVKDRFHFFGQNRVYAMGPRVTGALPSGTEISKGIREQDPKSVFEVENTSGNSQSTSPSCSMAGWVQTRKNKERWSGSNRSSSAGEGGVTAEAAPPVSGKLVTAETWQSANWPGEVPQRGWRVARHLTERSKVERGRPQRGRPARGLRLSLIHI